MTLKRDILIMSLIAVLGILTLVPYFLYVGFIIILLAIIPKIIWNRCIIDVLFSGKTFFIFRIKNAYPITGQIYSYFLILLFLLYMGISILLIFK